MLAPGRCRQAVICCCLIVSVSGPWAHPGIHEQVSELNERLKQQPTYQLYAQRAHLYFESGQIELALKDLDTASQMGPKEPLLFEYGKIFLARNQNEKAIKHFNKFIKYNDKLPEVFQARAKALQNLGRTKEAIQDIQRALQLHPYPHPGSYIEAANIMTSNQNSQAQLALDLLDEGIQKLGVQGQLQERAIELLMGLNRQPEALDRMVRLGIERNHNVFWQHDYAMLLIKSGRTLDAQAALQRILNESKSMGSPAVKELRLKIEQQLGQMKGSS